MLADVNFLESSKLFRTTAMNSKANLTIRKKWIFEKLG